MSRRPASRRALWALAAAAMVGAVSAASLSATTLVGAASPGTTTTTAASRPLSALVVPALGPGYTVVAEGPLDPSKLAADAPDPTAAAGALGALGSSISTYQRTWQDVSKFNEVQDLVVRFPTAAAAQVFLRSVQHSLDAGEIVSSGALPSVPGAHRVTYFGATTAPGVGQAITMRAGDYVALLSFFSAASGNAQPISPADGVQVARAQQAALAAAPGGRDSASKGVTVASLGWAALAVAVLAAAVATPLLLRLRHRRAPTASPPAPAG